MAEAARAIARRTFADARTRTISFFLLFFYGSAAQVLAYRSAYKTRHDRLQLAQSFGENKAVRLLYGEPHDLLTVGGYAAWRLGFVAVFAGLFGIFAAVRAIRAEEEAGRMELILAGPISRLGVFRATLVAVAVQVLVLWVALFLGLTVGRPGVGGSAYLALALVTPAMVFVGVGAVAAQLAPTRRGALSSGGGALALALLLRMVADTTSRVGCAGRRRSAGRRSCGRSRTRNRSSCSFRWSRRSCSSGSRRGSRSAATSAPASCPRTTPPRRASSSCPPRPRWRCASRAGA